MFNAVSPARAECSNIDEPQLSCLTTPLLIPGPGGAGISIHPSKAIIPRGDSLTVNCSNSCDQKSTFGLETVLIKEEVGRGDNWKVFQLRDVQEDIELFCYSNCHKEQTIASMNLTVYCEWLGPGPGLGRLCWGGGQGSPQQVGTTFMTWWVKAGSH